MTTPSSLRKIVLRSEPPTAPRGTPLHLQQLLSYMFHENGIRPGTAKGAHTEFVFLRGATAAGMDVRSMQLLALTGSSILAVDL